MYYVFGVLILILLILSQIHYYRRKCIIRKLKCMTIHEKCEKINALIEPFGYCYDHCQDIFSSTLHPWQRSFGYGQIYDRLAVHFQMVFDCQPIYFNYNGKTWLIEFWKGQYGINTGAEIGIYHSDRIVPVSERKFEIFQAASDIELLPLSMELRHKGQLVACLSKTHWWLTAFHMGHFTRPKDLCMKLALSFPNHDMMNAFTDGLAQSEFPPDTIYINGLHVSMVFDACSTCRYRWFKRCYVAFIQWKNRCFCRLFLRLTKPFELSLDRVLYLYEYAPFAFRKMFSIHYYGRRSHKRCC